jgi:hypothetical protein
MDTKRIARRRRRRVIVQRRVGFGAGCLALVAALFVVLLPHAQLTPSRRGLLRLRTSGWGVRVLSAVLQTPHRTPIALNDQGGVLWPARDVAPGLRATVVVRVAGVAGIVGTVQETVVTPPVPRIVTTTIQVALGHRVAVTWRAPVADVRVEAGGPVAHLHIPADTVALGPVRTKPGQSGVWVLRVRPRPWEQSVQAGDVQWRTVPWLTATLTAVPAPTVATPTLEVRWSAPLETANLSAWRIGPGVHGHWRRVSATLYLFHVETPLAPDTRLRLVVPGGAGGPRAEDTSFLQHPLALSWATPSGLYLRLQQWLAELGYLPVRWTPSSSATPTWASVYDPPAGVFSWRYPNVPAALQEQWAPGEWNVMLQGAMLHFEHHMHLPETIGPTRAVWVALRQAVRAGDRVDDGYSYVYVSETLPEQLWLWRDGTVKVHSLANTGIAATPTSLGTYPVYEKLPFQVMRGVNPDGQEYADPVHWINYFWGSEAVHGFVRQSYGFPQSLGCVELPIQTAETVYNNVPYGTLVTIAPPGSGPL